MIGWLARVGPKNSLIRLYLNNNGQPPHHLYSTSWQQLHSGFTQLINSLRDSDTLFPSLGHFSSTFGVIEVSQARTPSNEISSDFALSLTLNNRRRMSLFLPRRIGNLGRDFALDWVVIQNGFSNRLL